MKLLIVMISALISLNAFSSVICTDLQANQDKILNVTSGNVVTEENWKQFDVLASYPKSCLDIVDQEIVEFKGQKFWRFTTTDDSCDGGNTYGSIYSLDLKKPMAHIYDGDIYCEKSWQEDFKAINHKCDLAAEKLAEQKMSQLGLQFKSLSSSLEIRKSYLDSYIFVMGVLKNVNDKPATLKVLVNLKSCAFGSVYLDDLKL